jgi:hypothetical protein
VKRGGGQRLSNTDNIFAAAATLNIDSCNLTAFGDSMYFPRAAAADLSKKLLRIAGFSPASPQPQEQSFLLLFLKKKRLGNLLRPARRRRILPKNSRDSAATFSCLEKCRHV